jgi:inhibitor of growth protein 3
MHYDLPLPMSTQLEGPGVPPVRAYAPLTNNQPAISMDVDGVDDTANTGDAEGEGDGDDEARYCYCQGVSHGEMVGCDGEGCAMAWVRVFIVVVVVLLVLMMSKFHLSCIGLTEAPAGNWYCNVCAVKEKSTPRRGGRGGKRRTGGRTGKGGGANAA